MMRLRSLVLLLMCALASACATTGQRAAETATPQPAPVVAGDGAAAGTSTVAAAGDVEASVGETPVTTDAMPVQDAVPGDAEDDFAAIYGQPGDGGTQASPGAAAVAAFDPWEKYNRRVHAFNMAVDRGVAKPLARAYVAAVPRPLRTGVGNFFDNLGQPVTVVNSLLQGNPRGAANALGRFLVNSTVGIGGLFDVATKAKIPRRGEDFGQTLAVWGWQRSRYLELPLLGPRTVRDMIGLVGDARLRPVQYVEDDKTRVFLQGLQLVDLRTNLFAADSFRNGAYDDYALTRDAWLQRRNYQIDTNNSDADAALPSYLQDDAAPDSTTPDSTSNSSQDAPAPQPAQ